MFEKEEFKLLLDSWKDKCVKLMSDDGDDVELPLFDPDTKSVWVNTKTSEQEKVFVEMAKALHLTFECVPTRHTMGVWISKRANTQSEKGIGLSIARLKLHSIIQFIL